MVPDERDKQKEKKHVFPKVMVDVALCSGTDSMTTWGVEEEEEEKSAA